MKYLLQFQTVDGNGEEEIEFDTLEAARKYEASLEPWLVYSGISTYEEPMETIPQSIRALAHTMAAHLAAQQVRSFDSERNCCMYRASDGARCAVGALLTDECYSPGIEGVEVNVILRGMSDRHGAEDVASHLHSLAPDIANQPLAEWLGLCQEYHDARFRTDGYRRRLEETSHLPHDTRQLALYPLILDDLLGLWA